MINAKGRAPGLSGKIQLAGVLEPQMVKLAQT